MPEDTPGNPGVLPAGPEDVSDEYAEEWLAAAEGDDFASAEAEDGAPLPGDRVRGMQVKLHRWAGEDSSRRFGDLWNLVCDYDFLARSWDRVRSNRGARTPGVDGVRAIDVQYREGGVSGFLEEIRGQLRDGSYRPSAVRRVEIPKKNGKFRKLGIPTVADRVVQGALKLVLEPVFEADFLPCSYGFRPNRRAQDAIAEIHYFASRSYTAALEADIRACLDPSSHCSFADFLVQKSPSCGVGVSIRRPFLRPVRVRTARSSPRLTFCNTVCREMPRARLAWCRASQPSGVLSVSMPRS
jgi:Reverse transcriptase (RNA-dependent DNA polymerase)